MCSYLFLLRTLIPANVYADKGDVTELLKYVEGRIGTFWLTVTHLLEITEHAIRYKSRDYERALEISRLRMKFLEIFDEGGADFYATARLFELFHAAELCRETENIDECLHTLERFCEVAGDVARVAKSKDFHISARNTFFRDLAGDPGDIEEEYTDDANVLQFLSSFEEFLGGNAKFEEMKAKVGTK